MRGKNGFRVAVVALAMVVAATGVAVAGGPYEIASDPTEVGPDSSGSATAKCGDGSSVTGGGFSVEHQYALNGFLPTSKHNFSVTADNDELVDDMGLTAYAVCDPKSSLKIVSKSREVPDQTIKSVRARCPRGMTVAGGGVRIISDSFYLLGSYPKGARTWVGRIHQFGVVSGDVITYAICNKDGDTYEVEKESKPVPPKPRHTRGIDALISISPKCKNGTSPASGGHRVTGPGAISVDRSQPAGQKWEVDFKTYAGKDLSLTAYAVCGSG